MLALESPEIKQSTWVNPRLRETLPLGLPAPRGRFREHDGNPVAFLGVTDQDRSEYLAEFGDIEGPVAKALLHQRWIADNDRYLPPSDLGGRGKVRRGTNSLDNIDPKLL